MVNGTWSRAGWLVTALCLICSCVAPETPGEQGALRDGFPSDELWVVNGLAETVSLVNVGRLAAGTEPAVVSPLFVAGRVPNRIVLAGGRGLIVNSYGNSLTVFSLREPGRRMEIPLVAGANPWDVAVVNQGGVERALVTCFLRNSLCVVRLDGYGGWLEREIALTNGSRPEGIASDGTRAWIAMSGWNFSSGEYDPGRISVVALTNADVGQWAECGVRDVDTNPQVVLHDALAGRLHVLSTGRHGRNEGAVNVLNATTLASFGRIAVGGSPQALVIDDAGDMAQVAGGLLLSSYRLSTLVPVTNGLAACLPADSDLGSLALDPARRLLCAGDFARDRVLGFDLATETRRGTLAVGDGPVALAYGIAW